MHNFSASQPDLNWDNPEVRDAVFDVIDYWGKKGTDGFRVSFNAGRTGTGSNTSPVRCYQSGLQNAWSAGCTDHKPG